MGGQCVITYVDPIEQGLFFINDLTGNKKDALIKHLTDISRKDVKRLFSIPEPKTVFGVLEDGEVNVDRVVRDGRQGDVDFQIFFLDSGELKSFLETPIKEWFEIPAQYQTVPAKALKCHVRFIDDNYLTRNPDFLKMNELNFVHFRVVAVEK